MYPDTRLSYPDMTSPGGGIRIHARLRREVDEARVCLVGPDVVLDVLSIRNGSTADKDVKVRPTFECIGNGAYLYIYIYIYMFVYVLDLLRGSSFYIFIPRKHTHTHPFCSWVFT
jgi:hypothetical protein